MTHVSRSVILSSFNKIYPNEKEREKETEHKATMLYNLCPLCHVRTDFLPTIAYDYAHAMVVLLFKLLLVVVVVVVVVVSSTPVQHGSHATSHV